MPHPIIKIKKPAFWRREYFQGKKGNIFGDLTFTPKTQRNI